MQSTPYCSETVDFDESGTGAVFEGSGKYSMGSGKYWMGFGKYSMGSWKFSVSLAGGMQLSF
jgi:hypothetical protein